MMDGSGQSHEYRVLVLTPTGKDAALTQTILTRAGVACLCCSDLDQICRELDVGAGAVLLAEEAVGQGQECRLTAWLARQPAWSDLPVLILARPGADSDAVALAMDLLGNVTVLERPTRVATLVSAVRSALRARQRQHQVRGQLRTIEQRERLFHTLVTASSQSVWQYHSSDDPVRGVDEANAAWWRAFTGQTEEQRSSREGLGWLDAVHQEDRAAAERNWQAIINADVPAEAEFRVRRHDGAWRWLSIRGVPLPTPEGEGRRWGGTIVDITERKQAELALLAKEAELHLVTATTPLILTRCGRDLRYLFANRAAAALFGLTPEQIIGRPIAEVMGESVFASIRPHIERVLRGEAIVFEAQIPYAGAGLRWVRANYTPERDARGTVAGWVASIIDITEPKRAEEALRQSEERFRSLVSVLTDVPWVADARGAFVAPQSEWEAYTGQTWEQHRGFGWTDALHADDRERIEQTWNLARETGALYEAQGRLWHAASHQHRYVVARAAPILSADRTVREWIGTYTDVHEQRLAEEALRDADRRKDEFLAVLAHELRNPLAPIRNSLHILRMTSERDSAAERVSEMLERQVNHMVRLVDDLLEISRISRDKIELRREQVEVAAIVRSALETSRPLIEAGGHKLDVAIPAEPLILNGDPVRLTQVVANLLNNSAKYTDAGGQIWLAVRREGDSVAISVRDTGIGIPADMLPRVFELFTQIDRSSTRTQGGLGIGLTLVKRLVEMHGGSATAHSEGPGRGSEFVVRLPLMTAARTGGPTGPGSRTRTALASQRVLVVDDNRDAAESLGMLLKLLGADVRLVYSGPEALDAVAIYKPNVVLLDIGMPGMDGLEVARRIRRQPEFQNTTLIALTGWGQEEDRVQSHSAGFDYHLIKPADVAALQTLLSSLDKPESSH